MVTSMDREIIREAYEDVRSNLTDTEWAVFKFESSEIVCAAKGIGFEEFQQQFMDDERAFGYIRIQMGMFAIFIRHESIIHALQSSICLLFLFLCPIGDEMSKRSKFLFLTWIGCDVGVMQRAKMSTDKSIMKEVISVRKFFKFFCSFHRHSFFSFHFSFTEFCSRIANRM